MLNKIKKLKHLINWLVLKARRNVYTRGISFIEDNVEIILEKNARLYLGKNIQVRRNSVLSVSSDAELRIADNVFLAHGVTIAAREKISLGENTMIAEYVSIRDHDHDAGLSLKPLVARGNKTNPIGAKATIIKGSNIGDEAVIGANAVVTHPIPKQVIAAGVPARIIRKKK